MRSLLRVLILAALGATAPASAATGVVTGTVNFQQRFALPADALLDVRLEDTSRADAAAPTIARTGFPAAGKPVPIPFRIEFDPAAIDATHRYSVRATITSEGRLLYTSTSVHPVLTQGAGNDAAIDVYLLLPAGGAGTAEPRPAASLENTYWKLVAIGDASAIAGPGTREASFTLHAAERRLSGSTGCNRLVGKYDTGNGTLKLVPDGTTMMACPADLMQQEGDFVTALTMTTGYRISGDTLELVNADRVLARFSAVYFK